MNRNRAFLSLGNTPAPAPAPAEQWKEEPALYVFDQTLTANQDAPGLTRSIDKDSDFLVTHVYGTQTGTYEITMYLPNGRPMMSAAVKNANFVGTAQWPVPLPRPVLYPAGSNIKLDVEDTSGAGNTVQIVFKGIRRYRVG